MRLFTGKNLSSPDVQGADFVELFLILCLSMRLQELPHILPITWKNIYLKNPGLNKPVSREMPIAVALAGGYLFFAGFTALSVWRLIGVAFSLGHPPYLALSIIAVSLILLNLLEWEKCRHS